MRALVDRYYDFVWRSLRRLGITDADAEDAAQEVFVSLSGRLDDVEVGSERGFLYRTALNQAAHARRTRLRRREVPEEVLSDCPAVAPGPDELLAGARAKQLFYQVLGALDLDLRAVFVLYELEQMTMAEIATVLELPPGTVASRLRRARAAFLDHASRVADGGSGGAR
ncbi:MAG: sigma-70 family RNA polymerase sigma factor [Myxococcales bacterium]|nr:sigma-70 family RNA polymerase sigma factor [Myxococcales bacterium]